MRYMDFKYYALALEVEKATEHEFSDNEKSEYDLEMQCTRCGFKLCRYSSLNSWGSLTKQEKECNPQ